MTAHDLTDPFDVRRATAGDDLSDLPEVAGAQQTRTDDREETGVGLAAVSDSSASTWKRTERAPSWIGSAALGMNDFYSMPFKNASTRSPSSAAASSS